MDVRPGLFKPDMADGQKFWEDFAAKSAVIPFRFATGLFPLLDEQGEHWLLSHVGDDWLLTCAVAVSSNHFRLLDLINKTLDAGLNSNAQVLVELARESDCVNFDESVQSFSIVQQDGVPIIKFNALAEYWLGTVTLRPE